MKKIITGVVILTVCIIFLLLKYQSHTYKLIVDDIAQISGFIYGYVYECDDEEIIALFIDTINNSEKEKQIFFHRTCDSPGVILHFWDNYKNDRKICIYGDYLVFEKKQYKINAEQLCNQLIKIIGNTK